MSRTKREKDPYKSSFPTRMKMARPIGLGLLILELSDSITFLHFCVSSIYIDSIDSGS